MSSKLVFPENDELLSCHLQTLANNAFQFPDFYWFVDPKGAGARITPEKIVYNGSRIIEWMRSLYYDNEFESTPNHIKCTMRSTLDKDFSIVCYITSSSLPQEAIDSIPVCRDSNGFRVILGRRAANSPVCVMFGDTEIEIRGVSVYVLYGEHLLPEKKRQIEQLYKTFLDSEKPSMKISTQDASEALRAIYEEGGFIVDGQVEAYMLKKDDAPGRDARYWTFGSCNQYGYERISSSYNILLVIPTIDKLPEPIDTTECQKGVIVSAETALQEFRQNGSFEPVFPCHVRQLALALHVANNLE